MIVRYERRATATKVTGKYRSTTSKSFKSSRSKEIEINQSLAKRKKQCFDAEPLFAKLKHNHHFRRFMLRGIEK